MHTYHLHNHEHFLTDIVGLHEHLCRTHVQEEDGDAVESTSMVKLFSHPQHERHYEHHIAGHIEAVPVGFEIFFQAERHLQ